MATSSDITDNMHLVDLDFQIIAMGIALLEGGNYDTHPEWYAKHPRLPSLCYNNIEVMTPVPGVNKGNVAVTAMSKTTPPPEISEEMLSYPTREYLGKKIYIHPDHIKFCYSLKGIQESMFYRFGFIYVTGMGVISYVTGQD